MYGAYWCPHCARQRELFGKEAWSFITYIECSPKGYNYDNASGPQMCQNVSGFPSWSLGKMNSAENISGEVPLSVLAEASKFIDLMPFDSELEEDVPPLIGSACSKQ
jgi:rubredoxin